VAKGWIKACASGLRVQASYLERAMYLKDIQSLQMAKGYTTRELAL